jgi:hypothetical protein
MNISTPRIPPRPQWAPPNSPFLIRLLLFLSAFLFLTGCGAPGEPTPPRQPVPTAVTDLSARQLGDGVLLTFTLPKKAVDGLALAEPPSVEIYRSPAPSGVKPSANASRLVFTIPPAMLNDYLTAGRIEFRDPLSPEDVTKAGGEALVYTVRTRASKKRASGDSNAVSLRVYPAPVAIGDVQTKITESAIELSWPPPARTTAGTVMPAVAGYHVYRAELETQDEAAAAQDPSKAKRKTPLEPLATAPEASYRDTQFEFGHTYLYIVRSVAQYGSESIESADSAPAVVTPRDTFPPPPPANLVAIAVPAVGDAAAHIELSWNISSATDLAGYNVYRSEGDETSSRGECLNQELLLAPAFRDVTAVPGHRYTYRVTSVDRTGNESAPSAAVTIDFTPRTP